MPDLWVAQEDTQLLFKEHVYSLLVAQAIMSLVAVVLALFLLKSQPDFDILNVSNQ